MKVIKEKTEERLLQTLRNFWEEFPTHRCLHLKLSQIQDPSGNVVPENTVKEWLDVIFITFSEVVDDKSSKLYVCHDRDVFILTRTLTHKRVEELLAHLSPKLTPALSSPGLATLFEIGVDWPKLRTLCEKKIETLEILNSQRQIEWKEKTSKISREEMLKTLDKDLISSLAMRREQRETPEIMIVEDDLFSQKLIGNALKSKYKLSMSSDGAGALMSYVNKAPDVLFLDIGLPDMNGHEVLERIFKLDPDAYVVMFSGNGDKENVMKAVDLGAKGFVGKPFTQERLLQYIEKSPFIQEKQKKESIHGDIIH